MRYERVFIEEVIGAMQETLEQAYGCWINHYGENPEGSPTPPHISRLETAISMLKAGFPASKDAMSDLARKPELQNTEIKGDWDFEEGEF